MSRFPPKPVAERLRGLLPGEKNMDETINLADLEARLPDYFLNSRSDEYVNLRPGPVSGLISLGLVKDNVFGMHPFAAFSVTGIQTVIETYRAILPDQPPAEMYDMLFAQKTSNGYRLQLPLWETPGSRK